MTSSRASWIAVCGATLLALSACGAADTDTAAPAPTSAVATSSAPKVSSNAPAKAGGYVDYATYRADPAAYADGRVVLFFHASWCPNCRRTDKNLTEDPTSVPADLTIVKVDFDTETELRSKYGITQQHTFVAIGPDGAEKAKWTGTDTGEAISKRAV